MHFFPLSSGEQAIADALAEHLNRAAFTTHCCSIDYARRNAHPIVHARRWRASQCVIHTSDVCVCTSGVMGCGASNVCARACVVGVCVAICVNGCVFPSCMLLVCSEFIKAMKESTQCPPPLELWPPQETAQNSEKWVDCLHTVLKSVTKQHKAKHERTQQSIHCL
jgi:hypothetical protein